MLFVCACDSRYGAYFVIKSDVEFDAVEVYFGTPIDSSGPGSGDSFATPTFGAQRGTLFDRTFADADVLTVGATTETTFYVPPTEANQQLGAYVAAVALSGGHPVGIAEYFGFAVPSDVVHEYQLKLAPWNPQEAERWGDTPGCLVWKHARDNGTGFVAVVHGDDRDCDTLVRNADCNDLCSAGSPACAADTSFCGGATGVCALGCSANGVCSPSLCLPPATCDTTCAALGNVTDRLACGAAKTSNHAEIFVERNDTLQMCAMEFLFSPGVPCVMPKIEAKVPADLTGFTYAISSVPGNTMMCNLGVIQDPMTPLDDFDEHHLLISFAPPTNIGPRPTVVIGIQAKPNSVACANQPYYLVQMPTPPQVYACP